MTAAERAAQFAEALTRLTVATDTSHGHITVHRVDLAAAVAWLRARFETAAAVMATNHRGAQALGRMSTASGRTGSIEVPVTDVDHLIRLIHNVHAVNA